MAFRDFTASNVYQKLGLTVADGTLFPGLQPVPVRSEFAEQLQQGLSLAAAISTEKARSEFGIAPLLLELYRITGGAFKLFSGVEWDVDREKGLNGFVDFLLTWGPSQYVAGPPFAVIIEAKNDPIPSGLGQCMAAMYAGVLANGAGAPPVYGAVTNGREWRFLRIEGRAVTIDQNDYRADDLPRLLAALEWIVRRPTAAAA